MSEEHHSSWFVVVMTAEGQQVVSCQSDTELTQAQQKKEEMTHFSAAACHKDVLASVCRLQQNAAAKQVEREEATFHYSICFHVEFRCLGLSLPSPSINQNNWQHSIWAFDNWMTNNTNVLFPSGEGRQVEDVRWSNGRADHQRRAGDAPSKRLHPGLQTGCLEGDLSLRKRLHPAGDPLGAAARKDGERRCRTRGAFSVLGTFKTHTGLLRSFVCVRQAVLTEYSEINRV